LIISIESLYIKSFAIFYQNIIGTTFYIVML